MSASLRQRLKKDAGSRLDLDAHGEVVFYAWGYRGHELLHMSASNQNDLTEYA